jgi:hypothetical protein
MQATYVHTSNLVRSDLRELRRMIRTMTGKPVRILHDGVDYGVHNEFGTIHMAPHPFMTPAADAVKGPFEQGWRQLDNLEDAEAFVEKIARDAEGIAKANAPVDTGALKASIAVHKPEEIGQ